MQSRRQLRLVLTRLYALKTSQQRDNLTQASEFGTVRKDANLLRYLQQIVQSRVVPKVKPRVAGPDDLLCRQLHLLGVPKCLPIRRIEFVSEVLEDKRWIAVVEILVWWEALRVCLFAISNELREPESAAR